MREIKFRAWDKESKAWMYVTLKDLCDCVGISEYAVSDTEVERFTLGKHKTQFTGLKDKYGTEIYEGDVVKSPTYPQGPGISDNIHKLSTPSIVGWNERLGGWTIDPLQKGYEVVGNIYENPELLKEEK